ncbi:head-tail connector protein [Lactobacillus amylolyticus]|uniref:head-tail connector protein n=1 Tax=Lactobacillus amylolyticus TaxID=83683 RepID=UPI002491D9E0|nr:head-tail connector protein [Lactobacillus amylolyticus]
MTDPVVTVDEFENAFHVDDTQEDQTLISEYITAAQNYIVNAVGEDLDSEFYTDSRVASLFKTAVMSLAGSYYQYRMSLSDVQTYEIDLTLNSIIGQLRGLWDEIEGDLDAT